SEHLVHDRTVFCWSGFHRDRGHDRKIRALTLRVLCSIRASPYCGRMLQNVGRESVAAPATPSTRRGPCPLRVDGFSNPVPSWQSQQENESVAHQAKNGQR